MKQLRKSGKLGWWALMLLWMHPSMVMACATCFGKSDSDMAKGMNAGILTLLLVVAFMLASFASFFVFLARRSSLTPMPGETKTDGNPDKPQD